MPTLAAQIAQRAFEAEPSSLPPDPAPLTPAAVIDFARQAEAANEDPWEAAKQINALASDPSKMQMLLENVASEFDEHAPQIAMDARIATARAVNFLASKAPKSTFYAPGMPKIEPTKADLNKWTRYLTAVKDPTSILDDALKGTLAPEGLEAVRAVYPETYSEMQIALADRINNATKVPYHRKIQLSALLGQDMSGTLNPRLGVMAQGVYAQQGATPEQKPEMPVSRAKGLGAAGRAGAETAAWREAQRGVGSWNKTKR